MKIHGTAKGGALSTKDFGVAFGGAPGLSYPQSMGTDADLENVGVTLNETDEHLGSGCWSFGGYTPEQDINATSLLTFSTTIGSISIWVWANSGHPDYYVMTFGDASANEFIAISNEIGKARVHCRKAGSDQWKSESATDSWTVDAWHNITIVQNGTAVKWYFDGTEQTVYLNDTDKSAWIADLTGLDNLRIGAKSVSNQGVNGWQDGLNDSICFWNTALSSSLIAEIWNSGTGITIPEISSTAGIRAFYNCDSLDMENNALPI